ncbi:MAG: type II toxin-antitoxin system HicA family toxin [Candidatus Magasanikbacteria bacterium]|nr:type II toxin-antitoxin system HicA family toxin [Candidatus Magasanikbacteria bacterium]
MPRLPRLTSKQVIQLLKQNDFLLDHVTGSHYIFYNTSSGRRVTVPYHTKDLPIGTLKSILRESCLEF